MQMQQRPRERREFKFVEEGTFIRRAEHLRDKETIRTMIAMTRGPGSRRRPTRHGEAGEDASSSSGSDSDDPDAKLLKLGASARNRYGVTVPPKSREWPVPDLEWWDAAYLPQEKRKARATAESAASKRGGFTAAAKAVAETPELQGTYDELKVSHCKTLGLVEHPVPVAPAVDATAPRAMPMMLTKKERKRLRRQRRAEREKEKQDLVRLGLQEAPKAKVKISNLMRVLGEEAVADPSAVEARVRAEMEERQRAHDMRNAARALTPEE